MGNPTLFEAEPPPRPDDRKPWQRSSVDADTRYVGRHHPDTAQVMQRAILSRSGTFRRAIYDALAIRPATDDELEKLFGRSHQSVSGARATLKKDGWVRDSGERRRNRYGHMAVVWEVVPA